MALWYLAFRIRHKLAHAPSITFKKKNSPQVRESDAKRGRLIKAHCDQARKGAGTVGKLRIILELDAQRERFKSRIALSRSRSASSSNAILGHPPFTSPSGLDHSGL
jgi:hypothetical protein